MSIGASRHRGPSPFAMSGLKPRQTSAYMVPYYDWFISNVPVHPDHDTRCGKAHCPCAPDPEAPEAQEVEGPTPVCLTCGQFKKPYGRDAGPQHVFMCGYHCSGYKENPFPRLHWPGEKCGASQGKSTCAICGRAAPDAQEGDDG